MPFARLTLHPAPAPQQGAQLAQDLAALIAADLAKRHDLTSVLVETPATVAWTIGAGQPPAAAHLEVCVTAGTNDPAQKRAFVRNAMAVLAAAVPGLPMATYVVVREIPAGDWGFGGQTQAERARAAP